MLAHASLNRLSALEEEDDGDSGIDGHVGDCDPDDPLVIVLEVLDFCFGEETHQSNYI